MLENFKLPGKKAILKDVNIRHYETKLGEVMGCCEPGEDFEKSIAATKAKYVIIGVPEQAGVLANHGRDGTQTLWPSFLKSFLNIQSNDYLSGNEVFLGGYFDFEEELKLVTATAPDHDEKLKALCNLVEKIDRQVEDVVKIICRQNKFPIIIGGGHNNSYGNIKGAAKGLNTLGVIPLAQINVLNLDAHLDYRQKEGRHSGNGFRYADADGYLHKYFVIGPHENYLQQYMIKDVEENPFVNYLTYEDIFVRGKANFARALLAATDFVKDNFTGIELDVDSIERTLSSAITPCGLSTIDTRRFLHHVATESRPAYLHIAEGAVEVEKMKDPLTGKLVSYLVSDFIKSHFPTLPESQR